MVRARRWTVERDWPVTETGVEKTGRRKEPLPVFCLSKLYQKYLYKRQKMDKKGLYDAVNHHDENAVLPVSADLPGWEWPLR